MEAPDPVYSSIRRYRNIAILLLVANILLLLLAIGQGYKMPLTQDDGTPIERDRFVVVMASMGTACLPTMLFTSIMSIHMLHLHLAHVRLARQPSHDHLLARDAMYHTISS